MKHTLLLVSLLCNVILVFAAADDHNADRLDTLKLDTFEVIPVTSNAYACTDSKNCVVADDEDFHRLQAFAQHVKNNWCRLNYSFDKVPFVSKKFMGKLSCLELFLKPNNYNENALYNCVRIGDKEGLRLILPLFRDRINTVSNGGYTALAVACEKGFTSCVKLLIAAGADQTIGRCLPLHVALIHFRFGGVKIELLKALLDEQKAYAVVAGERSTILHLDPSAPSFGLTTLEVAQKKLAECKNKQIKQELSQLIKTMEQIRNTCLV